MLSDLFRVRLLGRRGRIGEGGDVQPKFVPEETSKRRQHSPVYFLGQVKYTSMAEAVEMPNARVRRDVNCIVLSVEIEVNFACRFDALVQSTNPSIFVIPWRRSILLYTRNLRA